MNGYIIEKGKTRKTRNLAALRRKLTKNAVLQVSVGEYRDGVAVMNVFFMNGDQSHNEWASATVLANSLRNWRNLYGVELEWNGALRGEIHYENPFLVRMSS